MRDGGDVPGAAGQGAREEAGRVKGKIDDDRLDDLLGDPGGRRLVCYESLW